MTRTPTVTTCVRSRTCSTRRRTLSVGVCGTSPWPTLNTWPGRPPARSRTSSIRNRSSRQGASSAAGSRFPCTGRSYPTRAHASSSGSCQSSPTTSPPHAAASSRYADVPSEKLITGTPARETAAKSSRLCGATERRKSSRPSALSDPRVEHLERLGARARLREQVVGLHGDELREEATPRGRLREHEGLRPREVPDEPPSIA